MTARIFKPSKTAMQSGHAKSKGWVLEFEADTARRIDPLMGWTSAEDMKAGQVRLNFESRDDAVAYAERHKIPHRVLEEQQPAMIVKAYSDNFAHRRRKPWTH